MINAKLGRFMHPLEVQHKNAICMRIPRTKSFRDKRRLLLKRAPLSGAGWVTNLIIDDGFVGNGAHNCCKIIMDNLRRFDAGKLVLHRIIRHADGVAVLVKFADTFQISTSEGRMCCFARNECAGEFLAGIGGNRPPVPEAVLPKADTLT
jgi:hypothetical protein